MVGYISPRIVVSVVWIAVVPQAGAQTAVPFELGFGSGISSCRIGGVIGTVVDEFDSVSSPTTADCSRSFPDVEVEAVSSVTFAPAIADAVVIANRTETEIAIVARATTSLAFEVITVPVGDQPFPPIIPLDATIDYSLASMNEGDLAGGCSAEVAISQFIGGQLIVDEKFVTTTRFDGVPETGQLVASMNVIPGFTTDVEVAVTCAGSSDPTAGPVSIEAQGQVFRQGAPFGPFNQARLDDFLGEGSFPIEEEFQLIYIPEPCGALAAASCLTTLAWLRRRGAASTRSWIAVPLDSGPRIGSGRRKRQPCLRNDL